jgi:hypothetical protein
MPQPARSLGVWRKERTCGLPLARIICK